MASILAGRVKRRLNATRPVTIVNDWVVRIRRLTPEVSSEVSRKQRIVTTKLPDGGVATHVDDTGLKEAYADELIAGWEGCRPEDLRKIEVPIEPEDFEAICKEATEQHGGFIPYSEETARLVFRTSAATKFSNKVITALNAWNDEVAQEDADAAKKSDASPPTSDDAPTPGAAASVK